MIGRVLLEGIVMRIGGFEYKYICKFLFWDNLFNWDKIY